MVVTSQMLAYVCLLSAKFLFVVLKNIFSNLPYYGYLILTPQLCTRNGSWNYASELMQPASRDSLHRLVKSSSKYLFQRMLQLLDRQNGLHKHELQASNNRSEIDLFVNNGLMI